MRPIALNRFENYTEFANSSRKNCTPVLRDVKGDLEERAQYKKIIPEKPKIMMANSSSSYETSDSEREAPLTQIKSRTKRKFKPLHAGLTNFSCKSDRHTDVDAPQMQLLASSIFNARTTKLAEGSIYRSTSSKGVTICNPVSETSVSPKFQVIETVSADNVSSVSNRCRKRLLNRRNFSTRLDGSSIPISELNAMNDYHSIPVLPDLSELVDLCSIPPPPCEDRVEDISFASPDDQLVIPPPSEFADDENTTREQSVQWLEQSLPSLERAKSLSICPPPPAYVEQIEEPERVFPVMKDVSCHTPESVERRHDVRIYLDEIKTTEKKFSDSTRHHKNVVPSKSLYGKHHLYYESEEAADLRELERLAEDMYKMPAKYIPSFEWVSKPRVTEVSGPVKMGDGIYEGNSIYIYPKYVPIGIGPGKARICEANVAWRRAEKVESPKRERPLVVKIPTVTLEKFRVVNKLHRFSWDYQPVKGPMGVRPDIRQLVPTSFQFKTVQI